MPQPNSKSGSGLVQLEGVADGDPADRVLDDAADHGVGGEVGLAPVGAHHVGGDHVLDAVGRPEMASITMSSATSVLTGLVFFADARAVLVAPGLGDVVAGDAVVALVPIMRWRSVAPT